jgi:hypothetical protein
VFGEALAYLHRHNRVALTGLFIITVMAAARLIR